jgi:hypothetical protein
VATIASASAGALSASASLAVPTRQMIKKIPPELPFLTESLSKVCGAFS